jgi:hypothetical protein
MQLFSLVIDCICSAEFISSIQNFVDVSSDQIHTKVIINQAMNIYT